MPSDRREKMREFATRAHLRMALASPRDRQGSFSQMTEQQAQEVIEEHASTVKHARKVVAAIEEHPDPLLKDAVLTLLGR